MRLKSSISRGFDVKKLLQIVILVIFTLSGVFAYLIHASVQNYARDSHDEAIASQILDLVYERRLLSDDYQQNPTERAKSQRQIKQRQILELVKANEADFKSQPNEYVLYRQISQLLNASSTTFAQVVKAYESNNQSATLQAEKSRLTSELAVKGLSTIEAASKLRDTNHTKAEASHHHIIYLFSVIAIVFLAVLFISFAVIWRSANSLHRKEAEEAAMLGSIGDGVFAIDKAKRIVMFNKSSELLTGYTHAEAISKPYDQIFKFSREKTGEVVDDFIKTALGGTKTQMTNHVVLEQKSGEMVPVADSAAPVIDADGRIAGAVVVFRDVTRERQLEQAKDDFLSLASHQLRTPATAVKQFLGLVTEGYAKDQKEADLFIQDAYKSNEEQLQIIDDILNVAKIDAGRLELKLEAVEVGDLLKHAVSELAGLAKTKGHHLDVKKPGHAVPLSVDKLKITMSVQNLISNAIKYTPDGGKITVELKDAGDKVAIGVEDNGIGIAPEDLAKVFSKFGRIQTDFTAKIQGTGLGLYLVKQIIELHGGTIQVLPVAPNGTKFIIELPKSKEI